MSVEQRRRLSEIDRNETISMSEIKRMKITMSKRCSNDTTMEWLEWRGMQILDIKCHGHSMWSRRNWGLGQYSAWNSIDETIRQRPNCCQEQILTWSEFYQKTIDWARSIDVHITRPHAVFVNGMIQKYGDDKIRLSWKRFWKTASANGNDDGVVSIHGELWNGTVMS